MFGQAAIDLFNRVVVTLIALGVVVAVIVALVVGIVRGIEPARQPSPDPAAVLRPVPQALRCPFLCSYCNPGRTGLALPTGQVGASK